MQLENNITTTDNGGIALKSTNNIIVDYFMLFMRDLDIKTSYDYLEKCWIEDPKKTVAIIFNGRDRDKGKKEKKVANDAMLWLRKNKFTTYLNNIKKYIEKYGCWKDLNYIGYKLKSSDQKHELALFAYKLIEDKVNLSNNKSVSLCAKWASSENDKYDKRRHYAKKIASIIYGSKDANKMEKYRKEYLVPLRAHIDIVEKKLCEQKWSDINYESVPAVASKNLKNTFIKHDEARYRQYLEDVKNNKKKINVTGILPHELVGNYIADLRCLDNVPICETTEMQWRTIIENVKNSGNFNNTISVVDLSGSMFNAENGTIPAQVAIALGIITSICCTGQFKNKLITFSEEPEIVNLSDKLDKDTCLIPTLHECITNLLNIEYGFSTNFVKCNELIINYTKLLNVPQENMPKKMFVFTDMQFNNACSNQRNNFDDNDPNNSLDTVYKTIVKKYKENNYDAPKFIFWNLNSNSKEVFPVNCNTEGTAIVSGFSEQLLKIFMNYDDFKPEFIVDEILAPYIKEVVICDD